MPVALLGKKIGMTRYFTEEGRNIPVTVIQAGPCAVTQVKTSEHDGYSAVQISFEDIKPRRSSMALIAHDGKAGVTPKRHHREFRAKDDGEATGFTPGQTLTVADLEAVKFVDITGVSKGKGFQGVMKRHNFAGMEASHGCERMHRHGGAIGSHATDRGHGAKIKKGKRMPGRMGGDRVTVRSLDVISIDPDKNLLLVKGPVPGANDALLYIRPAVRLYKGKAHKQAGKA